MFAEASWRFEGTGPRGTRRETAMPGRTPKRARADPQPTPGLGTCQVASPDRGSATPQSDRAGGHRTPAAARTQTWEGPLRATGPGRGRPRSAPPDTGGGGRARSPLLIVPQRAGGADREKGADRHDGRWDDAQPAGSGGFVSGRRGDNENRGGRGVTRTHGEKASKAPAPAGGLGLIFDVGTGDRQGWKRLGGAKGPAGKAGVPGLGPGRGGLATP